MTTTEQELLEQAEIARKKKAGEVIIEKRIPTAKAVVDKSESTVVTSDDIDRMICNIFEVSSVDALSRNYNKPTPCKMCRKDFICPKDAWSEEDYLICRACGIVREKSRIKTPKLFWDADLLNDFPDYTPDTYNTITNSSLYIYGPTGTGKTRLGFAICHYILDFHPSLKIKFEEFHDIPQKLKGVYKPPKYLTEEKILERYLNVDVLFLDDIFGSLENDKPSYLENDALFSIIRERNNRKARTIITSNFELSQLEKKGFGARTTSRIAELCHVFEKPGEDMRLTMHSSPNGKTS